MCLTTALAHLAAPRVPVLSAASGAPIVPLGFAGSISRKGPLTLAVATVAVQGVGIDVECAQETDQKLAERILTTAERSRLNQIDGARATLFITAHFAMKEAVYKALRVEDQQSVDFEEVELTTLPEQFTLPRSWTPVATRVARGGCAVRIAVLLLDQDWVIAVASRE